MIYLAILAAPPLLIGGIIAGRHLLAPNRLGGRPGLVLLGAYCAMAELTVAAVIGPFADRPFDVGLALLAVGLFVVLWWRDRPPLDEILGQPVSWLLMLFTAGLVFTPFSLAPVDTLLRTTVAIALTGSALLLVRRDGFMNALGAVTLGASLLALGSVAWEVVGPGTEPVVLAGEILDSGFAGLPRHVGLTSSPNQFGRVSATAAVGGAVLLLSPAWARFGWIFQIIGVVGMFYAQSRTAIIVGVTLLFVTHFVSGRALAVATTVVVSGALAFWASSAGLIGVDTVTRKDAGAEELTTATGRTDLWAHVIDLAQDRPMTGVGSWATAEALAPAVEDGRIGFKAEDAHNVYLNIWLSQGLFGVGLLATFALTALSNLRRRLAAPGSGLILLTVACLGLTETVFWKPNSTLVFAAVAAAGLSRWRLDQAGDQTRDVTKSDAGQPA